MEYAKSLIKRRPGEKHDEEDVEDIEENWTFIGDENEESDVLSRVKSLEGKDMRRGAGLDDAMATDLEKRFEREMEKMGHLPGKDERGLKKDVKSQLKIY